MTNRDAKETIIKYRDENTIPAELADAFVLALRALSDINDCRNELCLKCGNYKGKHLGLCKDCRWEQ